MNLPKTAIKQPLLAKENEAAARERMEAFWHNSSISGRPAIKITAKRPYEHQCWDGPEDKKVREQIPEFHAVAARNALESQYFLAESMPMFGVGWGAWLVILHVMAGGDYEYNETGTAWMKPIPNVLDQDPAKFDPNCEAAQCLAACFQAAVDAVGNRGWINPPLLTDGLTTLSQMVGDEELIFALMERPDRVRAWAAALGQMFVDIFLHYYELVGHGQSMIFGGPFTDGPAEGVQCDFSVMLSPQMYREHVLPELALASERMSRPLYHLDGTQQMRFLDILTEVPNLRGIQWNPETHYTRPTQHMEHLKRIREKDMLLYFHAEDVDEVIATVDELGPDGIFITMPRFETRGEAEAALEEIEKRLG